MARAPATYLAVYERRTDALTARREPAMATEFYFNTQMHEVEEGRRSDLSVLMGPYPTREAAARALETAHERTEAWDRQDQEDRG